MKMEKMVHLVLFVGLLSLSAGQLIHSGNSDVTPSNMDSTGNGTQQPVIIGMRMTVKSVADLLRNSAEIELLVRQVESLIPYADREKTSVTVRSIRSSTSIA